MLGGRKFCQKAQLWPKKIRWQQKLIAESYIILPKMPEKWQKKIFNNYVNFS